MNEISRRSLHNDFIASTMNSPCKVRILSLFHDISIREMATKITIFIATCGFMAWALYVILRQKGQNIRSPQQMQDDMMNQWNARFREIAKSGAEVSQKLKPLRMEISQQTIRACKEGFFVNNEHICLDVKLTQKMIKETRLYSIKDFSAVSEEKKEEIPTLLEVVDEDTVNLAKSYQDRGLNPVGLNLGSKEKPGDAWEDKGCGTQEESLFYRSNYYEAYPQETIKQFYPIPNKKVVYTPAIQFFRKPELDYTKKLNEEDQAYEFHKPRPISFITAAHVNLSGYYKTNEILGLDNQLLNCSTKEQAKSIRKKMEILCNSAIANKKYEKLTKNKMRTILYAALDKGHDSIVLGALGCGAYKNPRYLNAIYWAEVLNKEFQGKFKMVGFAIRSFGSPDLFNIFKNTLTNPSALSLMTE